ncbi:unnamed protein product [Pleuronectes platessa]|uniref:Uncharacterized protein n=1 Tax=Pleuronectes platessa TaxID=8262 RepID=A0A9N7YBZ8_PLEPL|nr:unnamed protein product [Pleuronectes platessa]
MVCQRFSRKNVPTHGKDFLALGLVVWSSRGKFSGLSPDGTCGYVGSHCSLQRLWLEIPSPMPKGESLCAACHCRRGFPRHSTVRQEVAREEDFHLCNRETWWWCYCDSRAVPWSLGQNAAGRGPTLQAPSAASRANELPGQTNGVLIGD